MRTLIIPAAGNGERMKEYYFPKCLLPLHQRPILFRILDSWKKNIDQTIIVVNTDNKEIISQYVSKYFNQDKIQIDYVVQEKTTGTYFAIKKALEKSKNDKLILNWSDVCVFNKQKLKGILDIETKNVVFTTNKSRCRWRFQENKFIHDEKYNTLKNGIYGIFLINDSRNIFYNALKEDDKETEILESFDPFKFIELNYEDFKDIGDPKKYNTSLRITNKTTRAFGSSSKIYIYKNIIVKKTENPKLEKNEAEWYKTSNFDFTPKVFNYTPLILERLCAIPIFHKMKGTSKEFEEFIISGLFEMCKRIHTSRAVKVADFDASYEQYFKKTIARLEKINFLFDKFNKNRITINGISCLNPITLLKENQETIFKQFPKEFRFIHGDIQLSNTLIDKNNKIFLIDPRGYFGKSLLFGDPLYDFAKVYYGFCGGYDTFSTGKNQFIIKEGGFEILPILEDSTLKRRRNLFMGQANKIKYVKISKKKIDLFHAIIWLSVTEYIANDVLSAMYSYLKGTLLLNKYFGDKNESQV